MKRSHASIQNSSKSAMKKSNKSIKSIKSTPKTSKKSKSISRPASSTSKKTFWIVFGIACLGILLASILLWSAWPKQKASVDKDVLVSVNSIPITKSTFNFQYNLLPESYRQTFSDAQVLEQIIDEELVVQSANRSGVVISSQEIHERVQKVLGGTGISLADLQKNLDHYNISQDQFESLIYRQLLIEQYLVNKIVDSPVDDAAAKAEYEASKDKYVVAEQVTVRHILISNQRTDAAIVAKTIYDSVRSGADFCKYVENSTDDKGSRATCGQYTFPKGFMVPEFEQASFDMKDNEYRMVQTSFGYHIIKKINMTLGSVKSYESVKAEIVAQLQSVDRAQQYRALVNELRAQATIQYANGTTVVPMRPSSIGLDPNSVQKTVVENTAVKNDVPKDDVPAITVTGGDVANGKEVVIGEQVQLVPDQPSNAVAPAVPPAQLSNPANSGLSLTTQEKLSCIAKHATLYGISWSSDSLSAKNLFVKSGVQLTYVDCGVVDCKIQGIVAYPTWSIDGTTYLGKMTVDELASFSGC